MNDIDQARMDRRAITDGPDSGSAVGWAIGVLSAILAGLLVFVGIKYLAPANDEASPGNPTNHPSAPAETPVETPAASETPTPTVGPFDGRWVGAVTGDLHNYTADVVITDDGSTLSGVVNYQEFPCSGVWTQTARSGNHVDVHEVITAGSPPCYHETDITLVMKSDGTIAFAVFYSDIYHPTATLSRDI